LAAGKETSLVFGEGRRVMFVIASHARNQGNLIFMATAKGDSARYCATVACDW
jgi:hypothetical protein